MSDTSGQCPFSGANTTKGGSATEEWWPEQLNLRILHQHGAESDPMDPDFSRLSFDLGDATIFYGNFINTVISFLAIGFIVFLLVKAYNNMQRAKEEEAAEEDPGPSDTELLTEIRDALRNN